MLRVQYTEFNQTGQTKVSGGVCSLAWAWRNKHVKLNSTFGDKTNTKEEHS